MWRCRSAGTGDAGSGGAGIARSHRLGHGAVVAAGGRCTCLAHTFRRRSDAAVRRAGLPQVAALVPGKTEAECKQWWEHSGTAATKWPKEEDKALLQLLAEHPRQVGLCSSPCRGPWPGPELCARGWWGWQSWDWYAAALGPHRTAADVVMRYQSTLNTAHLKKKWTPADVGPVAGTGALPCEGPFQSRARALAEWVWRGRTQSFGRLCAANSTAIGW